MGFGKKLKKIAKHMVAPVFSAPAKAIEKATGIDWKGQLGIGATVGSAAGMYRGLAGRSPVYGPPVEGPGVSWSAQGSGGSGGKFNWVNTMNAFGPSVLGIAGDVYAAHRLAGGQEAANEASIASAREQMAFQERMSSTAHQREVEDLRATGLNPVLSANEGASSPAGQSATVENAAPDYRGMVHSAFEGRRLAQEVKESGSRIAANIAAAREREAAADAASASAEDLKASRRVRDADGWRREQENKFIRENPWYIPAEHYGKLVGHVTGAARDLAVTYGAGKIGMAKRISPVSGLERFSNGKETPWVVGR